MNLTELIGYLATITSTINLMPEIISALKTHHLKDVAWGMLILSTLSSIMWTLYGCYLSENPLIISSSISALMSLYLIYLKTIYSKKTKQLLKSQT